MRIKTRILLSLLLCLLVSLGLQHAILDVIVTKSFLDLETTQAQQDVGRCEAAVQREIEHISTFTFDWSAWDDTYTFVQDLNPEFMESNLEFETFQNYHLDVVAFFGTDGRLLWGRAVDSDLPEENATVHLPLVLRDLPPDHRLLEFGSTKDSQSGLMDSGQRMMLFTSRPIIRSDYTGPAKGTLLIGEFLDDGTMERLRQQVNVDIDFLPIIPLEMEKARKLSMITETEPVLLERIDNEHLIANSILSDYEGRPIILVRADIPRLTWERGLRVRRFTTWSTFVILVAVFAVIVSLLHIAVVQPLARLTAHILHVGRTSDLSVRIAMERGDEIGLLSTEFQRMMDSLSETRNNLMAQSYRSGMAEVAMGTLHNVGNAIQPASTNAGLLLESLKQTGIERLTQALDVLESGSIEETHRKKLLLYLRLSSKHISDRVDEWYVQVKKLQEQIGLVAQILSIHHTIGAERPVLESLVIHDLLVEAINSVSAGRTKSGIILHESLSLVPRIVGERLRLIQVLVNILRNALDAISTQDPSTAHIRVTAESIEGECPMVRLSIHDTGVGFSPGDTPRLFQNHWTTKAGEHRGVGLHWAATTVMSMGGRISAESPGPGLGACFHVDLPRPITEGER